MDFDLDSSEYLLPSTLSGMASVRNKAAPHQGSSFVGMNFDLSRQIRSHTTNSRYLALTTQLRTSHDLCSHNFVDINYQLLLILNTCSTLISFYTWELIFSLLTSWAQ